MPVSSEPRPQLVVDNTIEVSPLEQQIDTYEQQIETQRGLLLDDLEYFRDKLRELEVLDPLDYSGLATLYRKQEQRLRELLNDSSNNPTQPGAHTPSPVLPYRR